MSRDEDTPSHDVEFLDVDPTSRVADEVLPTPTHRWPRWLPFLLAAVVVAVVISLVVHINSKPSASPPAHSPSPTPSSVSAPSTSPAASSPRASVPPITVTELGHPLLGVTGRWELFGRGDGVVVRIQFARGRITKTAVPALHSSGPVFFVVGRDEAIVRPLDFVPGYRVSDGHPARQLSTTLGLGQGGPVFPGPAPNRVWATSVGGNSQTIGLTGLDDTRPGVVLPVPAGGNVQQATPDGAGYLLFPGPGGVYDSRPDGLHRVTTGEVLAVGPTRWLVRECDSQGGCKNAVIDQANRAGHTLRPIVSEANSPPPGVISPNGTTAAVIDQTAAVHLLDLNSGADERLSVLTNQSSFDLGSLVWSPDSRWLFIAAANGHLAVVDVRTRQVRDLGISLPNLSQIAIRSAPAN